MLASKFLPFIPQHRAVAAHGPAVFLVDREGVEILLSAAFLLDPCAPAVAGAQDRAAAPDDPAVVRVDETDAQ